MSSQADDDCCHGQRNQGLALATALLAASAAPHEPRALTIDRMVAISDGDHAASTYVDGILAPQDAGYRDVLTTMNVIDGEVSTAQVEVTNSVTSAPEILALTPDGGTAFVAERLAAREPGMTRAAELAAGTRLTAVDITDIAAPQIGQSRRCPHRRGRRHGDPDTRLDRTCKCDRRVLHRDIFSGAWRSRWVGVAGLPCR
ncbi:MAG: hypothetical protein ACSLE7_04005 [Mycobacterium sp.]